LGLGSYASKSSNAAAKAPPRVVGVALSADSRAELFGRPLSSLTATWFRTSPVL